MIEANIPGFGRIALEHLVCDYNGTLACDGEKFQCVARLFETLSGHLDIHVLTADTFGLAKQQLEGLPCRLKVLPEADQAIGKLDYVKALDPAKTVCVGNGRNDRLMLKEAALGIVVLQKEGAATQTVQSADVVCRSIEEALELLLNTKRLVATLRS